MEKIENLKRLKRGRTDLFPHFREACNDSSEKLAKFLIKIIEIIIINFEILKIINIKFFNIKNIYYINNKKI